MSQIHFGFTSNYIILGKQSKINKRNIKSSSTPDWNTSTLNPFYTKEKPPLKNTEDKPKRMRMKRSSSFVAECLHNLRQADLFHWRSIILNWKRNRKKSIKP